MARRLHLAYELGIKQQTTKLKARRTIRLFALRPLCYVSPMSVLTLPPGKTQSKTIGYLLWIFGFTGAHRFYFGKTWTGPSGSSPEVCSASDG